MRTAHLLANGAAIRELRVKSGRYPSELARAVDLSTSHLRNIENGHKAASDVVLYRLAAALGVQVEVISTSEHAGHDTPNPQPAEPRRAPTSRPEPTRPEPPPGRTRGPKRAAAVAS